MLVLVLVVLGLEEEHAGGTILASSITLGPEHALARHVAVGAGASGATAAAAKALPVAPASCIRGLSGTPDQVVVQLLLLDIHDTDRLLLDTHGTGEVPEPRALAPLTLVNSQVALTAAAAVLLDLEEGMAWGVVEVEVRAGAEARNEGGLGIATPAAPVAPEPCWGCSCHTSSTLPDPGSWGFLPPDAAFPGRWNPRASKKDRAALLAAATSVTMCVIPSSAARL